MASGKRQPSKQKRQNTNRQERQARQARAANANAPQPSSGGGSGSGGSGAAKGSGSLLGRLRGAATGTQAPRTKEERAAGRAERAAGTTAPASAAPATPRGSGTNANRNIGRSKLAQSAPVSSSDVPIGQKAALTGVLAAVAAIAFSFFNYTGVDANGDFYTQPKIAAEWATSALEVSKAHPDADGPAVAAQVTDWMPNRTTERIPLALGWLSLAMVLPLLGAGLAFRAVRKRLGSKVVNRAMYATLLGMFLSQALALYFLPAVIAVFVASWQVRKYEMTVARAAAADGGAIDVDVVDDEPADDAKA